jgi:hypothetical protein
MLAIASIIRVQRSAREMIHWRIASIIIGAAAVASGAGAPGISGEPNPIKCAKACANEAMPGGICGGGGGGQTPGQGPNGLVPPVADP